MGSSPVGVTSRPVTVVPVAGFFFGFFVVGGYPYGSTVPSNCAYPFGVCRSVRPPLPRPTSRPTRRGRWRGNTPYFGNVIRPWRKRVRFRLARSLDRLGRRDEAFACAAVRPPEGRWLRPAAARRHEVALRQDGLPEASWHAAGAPAGDGGEAVGLPAPRRDRGGAALRGNARAQGIAEVCRLTPRRRRSWRGIAPRSPSPPGSSRAGPSRPRRAARRGRR